MKMTMKTAAENDHHPHHIPAIQSKPLLRNSTTQMGCKSSSSTFSSNQVKSKFKSLPFISCIPSKAFSAPSASSSCSTNCGSRNGTSSPTRNVMTGKGGSGETNVDPQNVIRARLSFLFSSTTSLLHRKYVEEMRQNTLESVIKKAPYRPSDSPTAKSNHNKTTTCSTTARDSYGPTTGSPTIRRRTSTPISIISSRSPSPAFQLKCKSFLLVSTVVLLVKMSHAKEIDSLLDLMQEESTLSQAVSIANASDYQHNQINNQGPGGPDESQQRTFMSHVPPPPGHQFRGNNKPGGGGGRGGIGSGFGNAEPSSPGWPSGRPDMPQIKAINVKCEKNHMKVNMEFDRPFFGMVFSKGHYSDTRCIHLPAGTGQQVANFEIFLNTCGMSGSDTNDEYGGGGKASQPGVFIENTIILQYDPQVQEIWDQARRLRCTWYDHYEKAVSFRPFNVDMLDAVTANFLGDNIQCWMQVQVGKGPWASEVSGIVKIGQTMTMVLAIKDEENKFDMMVRNCIAHDGKHQPIQLVDEFGCVTRPKIMSRFQKVKNFGTTASVVSYAYFQAFKFPDSMNVHFQCVIQVCRHECPEQQHQSCEGSNIVDEFNSGNLPIQQTQMREPIQQTQMREPVQQTQIQEPFGSSSEFKPNVVRPPNMKKTGGAVVSSNGGSQHIGSQALPPSKIHHSVGPFRNGASGSHFVLPPSTSVAPLLQRPVPSASPLINRPVYMPSGHPGFATPISMIANLKRTGDLSSTAHQSDSNSESDSFFSDLMHSASEMDLSHNPAAAFNLLKMGSPRALDLAVASLLNASRVDSSALYARLNRFKRQTIRSINDKDNGIETEKVIQVVAPGDVAFNLDTFGYLDDSFRPPDSTETISSPSNGAPIWREVDGSKSICVSTSSFAAMLAFMGILLIVSCSVSAFFFMRFRQFTYKTRSLAGAVGGGVSAVGGSLFGGYATTGAGLMGSSCDPSCGARTFAAENVIHYDNSEYLHSIPSMATLHVSVNS